MGKSGIYKITNPINQVYIGQTVNLKQRLTAYMKLWNTINGQPQIYESLNKFSPKSHKYDVIEFCSVDELDYKESYYKQQFINEYGWDKALFSWVNDPPTSEERRARQRSIKKTSKTITPYEHKMKMFLKGNLESIL